MAEIDEIMADYLLKGAKMLAKTCPECHAPLFEYKGKQFCVACMEAEKEAESEPIQQQGQAPAPGIAQNTAALSPAEPNSRRGFGADLIQKSGPVAFPHLEESISETIEQLCERISHEPDPARCLLYMQAIREGALSIAALQSIEPHHHLKE